MKRVWGATESAIRVSPLVVAADPTPDDAAEVVEQLQCLMQRLEPLQRQILELALQNRDVVEISKQVQRSGRTIRRTLMQIRTDLESRLMVASQSG